LTLRLALVTEITFSGTEPTGKLDTPFQLALQDFNHDKNH
jgi:hypothetical protein